MNKKALFSSSKKEWETPPEVFKYASWMTGGFTLDVCATAENTKCPIYYDKQINAFSQQWAGKCWMNPPYGSEIKDWVARAHHAVGNDEIDTEVVALLPARTDPQWFHDHVFRRADIVFFKGRIKFVGALNCAPFPSMLAHWSRTCANAINSVSINTLKSFYA